VSLHQNSAFSFWQSKSAAIGVGAVAILTPLFALFLPKGLVALLVAGILIGAFRRNPLDGLRIVLPKSILIGLIGLSFWAATTSFWAIETSDAVVGALKIAGNLTIGALFVGTAAQLTRSERAWAGHLLVVGWATALATVLIELTFDAPVFRAIYGSRFPAYTDAPFWLNAGIVTLILCYWPVSRILRETWGTAAAITAFVLLSATTYLAGFDGGMLALLSGVLAMALVGLFKRRAISLFVALFAIVAITAPWAVHQLGGPVEAASRFDHIPASAQHRIAIWAFVSQHIVERPVAGWGMNASKFIPGSQDKVYLSPTLQLGEQLPLHPHNATLQIWLELGFVGIVFYFMLLYGAVSCIARSQSSALMMSQFMTALTVTNLSYGIWQAWWIATLWFAATMSLIVATQRDESAVRRPPDA
jgi:exopolysaccharide production protein ExoQ